MCHQLCVTSICIERINIWNALLCVLAAPSQLVDHRNRWPAKRFAFTLTSLDAINSICLQTLHYIYTLLDCRFSCESLDIIGHIHIVDEVYRVSLSFSLVWSVKLELPIAPSDQIAVETRTENHSFRLRFQWSGLRRVSCASTCLWSAISEKTHTYLLTL